MPENNLAVFFCPKFPETELKLRDAPPLRLAKTACDSATVSSQLDQAKTPGDGTRPRGDGKVNILRVAFETGVSRRKP
jgi:hypothetical protein